MISSASAALPSEQFFHRAPISGDSGLESNKTKKQALLLPGYVHHEASSSDGESEDTRAYNDVRESGEDTSTRQSRSAGIGRRPSLMLSLMYHRV
jgi:hypothetical protein